MVQPSAPTTTSVPPRSSSPPVNSGIPLQNLPTPNHPVQAASQPLATSASFGSRPAIVNLQTLTTNNPVQTISTPQAQPPTSITTSLPSKPTPNQPQNHLTRPSPSTSGSSTTSQPPQPLSNLRASIFRTRTDIQDLFHELLTRFLSLLDTLESHLKTSLPNLNPLLHALSSHIPLLLSTLLFLLTTYLTLSSTTLPSTSPLVRLSPQIGTFLLSLLSKLTDYGFQAVASSVREKVQWGVLIKKGGNLLGILTMGASFDGWWKVLMRKRVKHGNGIGGGGNGRAWYENPRVLSVVNIIFWCLIQLPGIIFMTKVNPESNYRPQNWITVSGGIGIYDSDNVVQGIDNSQVSNFINGLLQDPTQSISTDPANKFCKGSKTCKSFLLTGGLGAISPWPSWQSNDTRINRYMVKDAPSYQIDVDSFVAREALNLTADDCVLYGFNNDSAFQFCISFFENRAEQLAASWRACVGTILPSNECSIPWSHFTSWSTIISYHRVLATTVYDKITDKLLKVEHVTYQNPQIITPLNLTVAIDTLLCPLNSASTICRGGQPSVGAINALFTLSIQTILAFESGSSIGAVPSSRMVDLLQNLLVTPLLLFNPLAGPFTGAQPAFNGTQKNLPKEHYFPGSLATEARYVAPEAWTVYVYVAVAGFLLLFGWILGVWTGLQCEMETSSFPFVDSLRLAWASERGATSTTWQNEFGSVFPVVPRSDDEVIAVVVDKKVKLKPLP